MWVHFFSKNEKSDEGIVKKVFEKFSEFCTLWMHLLQALRLTIFVIILWTSIYGPKSKSAKKACSRILKKGSAQ